MSTPSLQDLYKQLSALTSTVNKIADVLHVTRYQVDKGKIIKEVVPSRNPLSKGSSRRTG